MNFKEYIQSPSFRGVIIGVTVTLMALIIFQAGVSVGVHKASFANRLGDNFERHFGPSDRGTFMPPDFPGTRHELPGGHGAVGEIVTMTLPEIVVSGLDGVEKTVVVSDQTIIRQFRDEVTLEALTVGTHVVVLGNPNDEGQVDAALIRILPTPPDGFFNPATGIPDIVPNMENI